jgi:hypothetical protein
MGRDIIVRIIEWMVRLNGSTHKVKEFLSSLFEKWNLLVLVYRSTAV